MKIGILSDTHDNLPKIERAVKFFNKNKVQFVLHAGDFVAPFTVSLLKKLTCDWRGIFGNNDGEKEGLAAASEAKIKAGPIRIELQDKKITMAHDAKTIDLDKEEADLIVIGHTHKPEIIKKYNKLIVNPGECGGWVTNHSTVSIVNLELLFAKIYKI
jgi:putative phosphoesterase